MRTELHHADHGAYTYTDGILHVGNTTIPLPPEVIHALSDQLRGGQLHAIADQLRGYAATGTALHKRDMERIADILSGARPRCAVVPFVGRVA